MTDIPTALADALADRYALERPIGRGGMATVYLARDLKHRRQVAVKVLRPDLAASLGADRFLKEIEIAARLSHPHILPLFDSGKVLVPPLHEVERGTGGEVVLFYVMPFVPGESLRGLLLRKGTLDRTEALAITRRVADALAYAHREGVLHRDIKPENVLMAEGHAVVADFGIAKAITTAGGVELTRTGFPLGTPGYMSPEQAAGISELDARTDVYSLACVCYEMLVSETPGMWLTDEAVRVGKFLDATPPHRVLLDRLPGGTEQALVRALAIRPDHRYATPVDFADALEHKGPARKFGHDTAVDIVNRAAEIDAARPASSDGLTRGGVERIAAEVGLPPARVREAIASLDHSQPPDTPVPFLGAPTSAMFEQVIDGELHEDDFPEILEEIRAMMGRDGHARVNPRSLSWTSYRTDEPSDGWDLEDAMSRSLESDPLRMHVRISCRGGKTRIRVSQRYGHIAGGLFGGIMGGLGGAGIGVSLGAGIPLGLPIAVAAGLAIVAVTGSWGLSRAIFVPVVRVKTRKLRDVFNGVVEAVTEAITLTPT